MKLTNKPNVSIKSGMTLIELTVVILVLLALIAVLFVGAKAYKAGADKAACIMNQRNIQQACRSYINLNPPATTVPDGAIVGTDKFIGSMPKCPATQVAYTISTAVVASGALFAPCPSLATQADHVPADVATW